MKYYEILVLFYIAAFSSLLIYLLSAQMYDFNKKKRQNYGADENERKKQDEETSVTDLEGRDIRWNKTFLIWYLPFLSLWSRPSRSVLSHLVPLKCCVQVRNKATWGF